MGAASPRWKGTPKRAQSPSPALMLLYNNVAELRQIRGAKRRFGYLGSAAPENLDVEVADFLAQGIAVDAQQIRGADLIAAGRSQGRRQQRLLNLAQDPVIQPGRRQAILEAREIIGQMPLDRRTEIFVGP